MSKSILVIDTPENCVKCNFKDGYFCGIKKRWIDEDCFPKPDWCPLRDLPAKMTMDNKLFFDESYMAGRNDCIEEILKGGE